MKMFRRYWPSLIQRSPMLATSMTPGHGFSLAGMPPLAGFFGKFLLLKAW